MSLLSAFWSRIAHFFPLLLKPRKYRAAKRNIESKSETGLERSSRGREPTPRTGLCSICSIEARLALAESYYNLWKADSCLLPGGGGLKSRTRVTLCACREGIKLGKTNVDKGRKKCTGCITEMARWPSEIGVLWRIEGHPLGHRPSRGYKRSGGKLGLKLELVRSSRRLQSSSWQYLKQ